MSNVGILFQTTLGQSSTTTGDGIHYVPAQNVQGLTGSVWSNVQVYGHDGNHYGFNLTNMLVDTFIQPASYGGGGFKLYGNSTSGEYGNSTFVEPYSQVIVGGSGNGFDIEANASSKLNLLSFVRPQAITDDVSGVTPMANPPTSAQSPFFCDANVAGVKFVDPDMETNVSSNITLCKPGALNDFDWNAAFTDAVNIYSPAWGTNGIVYGPLTHTYTDTTSSGATGATGMYVMGGTHVAASNAATYSVLATLYVAPVIAGTNVTITRNSAIYATGEIFTTSDIGSTGGIFTTGTANINKNASTNVTEIGDGNTTGQVTIGGSSNTMSLGSATINMPNISNAAGNEILCYDTTNGPVTYENAVSGCVPSAKRLKNPKGKIDPKRALDRVAKLTAATYTYKDTAKFGAKEFDGLYADEVCAIDERLCDRDASGQVHNYDKTGMLAYLVAALGEQKREIDALKHTRRSHHRG
jgi:hypothetical protein